jgi:hypothetical protein
MEYSTNDRAIRMISILVTGQNRMNERLDALKEEFQALSKEEQEGAGRGGDIVLENMMIESAKKDIAESILALQSLRDTKTFWMPCEELAHWIGRTEEGEIVLAPMDRDGGMSEQEQYDADWGWMDDEDIAKVADWGWLGDEDIAKVKEAARRLVGWRG